MTDKLTVCLIEDNTEDSTAIETYITKHTEDVTLSYATNSTDKALAFLSQNEVDVIILDLELSDGSGDGLTFLRKLPALRLSYKPYIIITTNNPSGMTHNACKKLGADFTFLKYQTGYAAKNLVDFFRPLKDIIREQKYVAVPHIDEESREEKLERLRKYLRQQLSVYRVNPKYIGIEYLVEAILIVYEDRTQKYSHLLAAKYEKTHSSVERAMETVIQKAWSGTDTDTLKNAYLLPIRPDKECPTLGEFIFYYADVLWGLL